MKGSDVVLLILTFILGIFAGFYFYVQFFIPEIGQADRSTGQSAAATWTMNVSEVGQCGNAGGCVQFQLRHDGTYRYQASPDAPIETGTLGRSERRDAERLALRTDWYQTERVQTCSPEATYWYQFDVMTAADRSQVGLCTDVFDDSGVVPIVEHFVPYVVEGGSAAGSDSADGTATEQAGAWWFQRDTTFKSPVQFWVYGLNYPGNDEVEE